MKRRFLIWLTKNWRKNKGKDYPQTWYYMPPRWSRRLQKKGIVKHHKIGYPLRRFLEIICGLLGGHELSKTEWGYGGGKFADRNCRWCDKLVKVPKESVYFQFKNSGARNLIKEMEREIKPSPE